jgi:hypothetical protein
MSNEYLWNGAAGPGSSPADQDVVRLENALRPLRAPLPPIPDPSRFEQRSLEPRGGPASNGRHYFGVRFLVPALALAAAIVLMVAGSKRGASAGPSWEVERMDGVPRVDSARLTGTGRLAVGQTLMTDAAARARLDVSTIGQVTVDHDTRVRLVGTRQGRHELALERGTLHAFITAPPGQFVVNTPSSTATDLGCVYTLHVDEDGTGLLSVTAGWVAFEYNGRESFVPARASARTDPDIGPGTPRYDDAEEIIAALDLFDRGVRRSEMLAFVLEHARAKDAMTLWHLLSRVTGAERPAVVDALDRLAPMPIGVTRAAVLQLDRATLDRWWDSLGLQDATWWRKWKGPYPAREVTR